MPRPGVGYWTRIRHGQKPARVPLPPRKDGVPELVEIVGSAERIPAAGVPRPPRPVPPSVPVPATLSNPHSAARVLQKALREKKANTDGILVLKARTRP